MEEYQAQIKQSVEKAVEEVIKQALKDGKKSKTNAVEQMWEDGNILP